MKIRPVSDLHAEFHRDSGEALLSEVTAGDFDVLVIAGDLANSSCLGLSMAILAGKTKKPIVYVVGNHEFYGSTRQKVVRTCKEMSRLFPHFHYLENEILEVDGVRFLGTPLWFRKSKAPEELMNDFLAIEGFRDWVYEENTIAIEFLKEELRELDVIITHYLPSERSVHKDYKGSVLNPFFLCDMEAFIRFRNPRLWIHGHTHRSCDYLIESDTAIIPRPTRIVCNPFGYAKYEENPEFDPHLIVEVPSG